MTVTDSYVHHFLPLIEIDADQSLRSSLVVGLSLKLSLQIFTNASRVPVEDSVGSPPFRSSTKMRPSTRISPGVQADPR